MKAGYLLAFDLMTFKRPMFYNLSKKGIPYLSAEITADTTEFWDRKSVEDQAPKLAEYFFSYPVEYVIYH